MYPPMELEGVRYYVKPMNCPMHHKIFGAKPRSYRDMPVRLAEYGTCYRFEKIGRALRPHARALHADERRPHLLRRGAVRAGVHGGRSTLYRQYFSIFNIDKYVMRLSTHHARGLGKKYVDNQRLWLKTEEMVRRAMDNGGVPYVEVPDEAAFYGPKIDVQIWSAIGREFTLATNQVDFAVPLPLRPGLHEPRGQRGDAALHPPCPAEHPRADDRLPDRALRRDVPGLAGARSR